MSDDDVHYWRARVQHCQTSECLGTPWPALLSLARQEEGQQTAIRHAKMSPLGK